MIKHLLGNTHLSLVRIKTIITLFQPLQHIVLASTRKKVTARMKQATDNRKYVSKDVRCSKSVCKQ